MVLVYLLTPLAIRTDARLLERTKNMKHSPVELGLQSKYLSALRGKVKVIASRPAGLGIQLQPVNRRRCVMPSIGRSTSAICFAALVSFNLPWLLYFLHPIPIYYTVLLSTGKVK